MFMHRCPPLPSIPIGRLLPPIRLALHLHHRPLSSHLAHRLPSRRRFLSSRPMLASHHYRCLTQPRLFCMMLHLLRTQVSAPILIVLASNEALLQIPLLFMMLLNACRPTFLILDGYLPSTGCSSVDEMVPPCQVSLLFINISLWPSRRP
jgi:hypothetical protein